MDEIEIHVDLRKDWPYIRDQGSRPSCLACATSDAHMHCHSVALPLSAEFLLYYSAQKMPDKDISSGLTFDAVHAALSAEGQPEEKEWLYENNQPASWTPPPVTKRWYGTLTNLAAGSKDEVMGLLEKHQPVILGIKLTSEFMILQRPPYIVPAIGIGFGGHAVLAVGLGSHKAGGKLILIRNSWGAGWADKGHGWLPQGYLEDKMIGYRTVSAQNAP